MFGDKPYEDAISFYNNHNYPKAVQRFESYMGGNPDSKKLNQTLARFYHAQANRILGEIEYLSARYVNALNHFQKAVVNDENNPAISQYMGLCYENLGKTSDSIPFFHKVLQSEPVMVSSISELRLLFYNENIWQRAIKAFENILIKNTNFADVFFHIGLAYLGCSDREKAMASLKRSLEINPRYVLPRRKLGIVLAQAGFHDEAIENFNTVLKWFPGYADMHYYSSIVHASNNRFDQALASLDSALEINPNYKDAKIRLGYLYFNTGNPKEGIKQFSDVLKSDNENIALKSLLYPITAYQEELEKGVIPESIEWLLGRNGVFSTAVSKYADNIVIIPNLSEMLTVLSNLPDIDNALFSKLFPILSDILKHYPNYSDIHNFLGTFYLKAGLFENAVESFKKAKQKNPEYLKARLNLFHTLKEPRNLEEVLKEGEELLQKNLSYPDFLFALGEVYDALGMYDEAERVIENALDKKPQFTQALFLLAQVCQKKGNMAKALEVLKRIMGHEQTKLEMKNAERLLDGFSKNE